MSFLRILAPGLLRRSSTATIGRLKPGSVFQVRNFPEAFLQIHQIECPKGLIKRLWHWLTGRTRQVITTIHQLPPLPEFAAQGFQCTPIQWLKDHPVTHALRDFWATLLRRIGVKGKVSLDAVVFAHTVPQVHPETGNVFVPYILRESIFGRARLVDGSGKAHNLRLIG